MSLPIISKQARPVLQIALDTFDMPSALRPLQAAAAAVDVIEVGTILCLAEGMKAVRDIRALFPEKPILADVRIVEAGSIIARLAFESGASLVSAVSGASDTTIEQVCKVAAEFGGQVQVEIGENYSLERAGRWRAMGVEHIIVKHSRDAEAGGAAAKWGEADFSRIQQLDELGFMVTVTGGIKTEELAQFAGLPVAVFIAGRSVVNAADPGAAAAAFQSEFGRLWP